MKKFKLLYLLPIAAMVFTGCNKEKDKGKEQEQQQEAPKEFAGLSFEDKTVVYNGAEQKIEVAGLPDGATATYGQTGNTFKNVGVYPVTATVSGAGYNNKTLTATLTITKADFTGLALLPAQFAHDGQPHTLQLTGTLPEGENAVFNYKQGFESATEVGVHEIKGVVTAPNYNDLELSGFVTIHNGAAAAPRMLSDFEAFTEHDSGTLKEYFVFDYYPSNNWIDVPTSAGSVEPNADALLGNGSKYLDITASHNAAAYRFYPKASAFVRDYKKYTGFSFDSCLVDVDPDGMTTLQFQLYFKDIPLPEQYSSLKDAWATYTVEQNMSRNWIHWEIPFDDASVSIMNGSVQLSQLSQLGLTMADLSLYLDKVAIVVKPNYMGGSKVHALFDNIQLLAGNVNKSSTQSIRAGKYSQEVEIESVKHFASLDLDASMIAGEFSLDGVHQADLEVERQGNSYIFKSGDDVIIEAAIENGGFRANSVTGTQAVHFAYLEGQWFPRVADVNYDLQDKVSAAESSVLGDSNWVQEKYEGGWKSAGNQMYVKKNGESVWTCLGTGWKMDYRYTYNIPVLKAGLANRFALDVGNDRDANAKEIKIKVKLLRSDGSEQYVVGDESVYASVPAGTAKFNTTIAHNNDFEEAEVRAIQIIVKSTDGTTNGFLYIDNMKLDYSAVPEKTLSNGSYYVWNGNTDVHTLELSNALTSAVVQKIGGDPVNLTAAIEGREVTLSNGEELVMKGRIAQSKLLKITQVTGSDSSKVSLFKGSLVGKRFKQCCYPTLTFEEGTSGSAYTSAYWTQEYYDSSWKTSTGKMNCRTKGGTKVVNMQADTMARKFTYTPNLPIGPVNHLDIDLGNYYTEGLTIKYKISIVKSDGTVARYIVGADGDTESSWGTIAYASVDALPTLHFDFNLTVGAKLVLATKCSSSTWLYMDNINLSYQALA